MNDAAKAVAWEESYERRENFVFSPSDEVVRFVARYLRRQKGLDDVLDVLPGAAGSKVLDIGCGVGRNLFFGSQMGLEMWGFDLSERAVAMARDWLTSAGHPPAADQVVASDIRTLPWPGGFFDHAMADSVLDSMSSEIAVAGIAEVARVLKPDGYFYCNLISSEGSGSAGDTVVATQHEQGTIQCYFDEAKARAFLEPHFVFLNCALHTIRDTIRGTAAGRWHLVLKRR